MSFRYFVIFYQLFHGDIGYIHRQYSRKVTQLKAAMTSWVARVEALNICRVYVSLFLGGFTFDITEKIQKSIVSASFFQATFEVSLYYLSYVWHFCRCRIGTDFEAGSNKINIQLFSVCTVRAFLKTSRFGIV